MSYEWPTEDNPVGLIVSQLDELNSLSAYISASTFVEILDVERSYLSPSETAFVGQAKAKMKKLATREFEIRAGEQANQFGQLFRDDTTKLIKSYFELKGKTALVDDRSDFMFDALESRLVELLLNLRCISNPESSDSKVAAAITSEYLILVETGKYGNPRLPAVDIYMHHPLVDQAAAFALAVQFMAWS